MAKRASVDGVKRQLLVLKNRVSFLERALQKARKKPAALPVMADRRDQAEREARREALKDYYRQRNIEHYRDNPIFLEIAQRSEDERNEYLRSRGLEPEPSDIPKELRRQARALVNRSTSARS